MADATVPLSSQVPAVRDHSRQYSKFTFVYPVISRRSRGLSIGVNLNPDKICNFDCIYCEVDRRKPGKAVPIDPDQIRDELVTLLRLAKSGGLAADSRFQGLPPALTRTVKDIAFSGDGEPTLVHNFADCVQTVADVKQLEGLKQTKIVLITDAAGLDKADVKRGLEIMDANQGEVWGKLDAGTKDYFRLVNRSHVRFERILKNLLETARVRPIVIQSLFLRVHGQPIAEDELEAYGDRLVEILRDGGQIKEVHAYTVARPTPEPFATRLSASELDKIARAIRERTRLPVIAFP